MQCLHQHQPLSEVLQALAEKPDLVEKYLRYKEHVCRQAFYDDKAVAAWETGRRREVEQMWPEYSDETALLETPEYTLEGSVGDPIAAKDATTSQQRHIKARLQQGKQWLRKYLQAHVQKVLELKQHHVHVWDEARKEYKVLEHCKAKDKKNECKSHFPRTKWLIKVAVVMCKGLLQQMEMPCQGRKNLLGSLHGPMNEPNVNGSHPAMLATQQCNSDVQLPYRLPISAATHSELCPLKEQCLQMYNVNDVVRACQLAQDAQAGYACDYQCKRQPCGCNEVRECCVGLSKLGQSLQHQPLAYVGKRYMGRILCHAYNNGIVRSAVENRNLRAYARDHDVTFAESFRTCAATSFAGVQYLQVVEKCHADVNKILHFERDLRDPSRPRLTAKNEALLYGHRPMGRPDLTYLSPYEFTMYWEPRLLKYPLSVKEDESGTCHAALTAAGKEKLRNNPGGDLMPGVDYLVKNAGGVDWVALEDVPAISTFRNQWILQRRRRPRAPHFKGCPLPRHRAGSLEQNAKITLTYFHPWTLRPEWSDQHVPSVQKLRGACESWSSALTNWLDGNIISMESKRYVSNFISIHRLRPSDGVEDDAANPDDMIEDEDVVVTKEMLPEVLETRIGGKSKKSDELELLGDGHHMNSADAIGLGRDIWSQFHAESRTVSQTHSRGLISTKRKCYNRCNAQKAVGARRQSR